MSIPNTLYDVVAIVPSSINLDESDALDLRAEEIELELRNLTIAELRRQLDHLTRTRLDELLADVAYTMAVEETNRYKL